MSQFSLDTLLFIWLMASPALSFTPSGWFSTTRRKHFTTLALERLNHPQLENVHHAVLLLKALDSKIPHTATACRTAETGLSAPLSLSQVYFGAAVNHGLGCEIRPNPAVSQFLRAQLLDMKTDAQARPSEWFQMIEAIKLTDGDTSALGSLFEHLEAYAVEEARGIQAGWALLALRHSTSPGLLSGLSDLMRLGGVESEEHMLFWDEDSVLLATSLITEGLFSLQTPALLDLVSSTQLGKLAQYLLDSLNLAAINLEHAAAATNALLLLHKRSNLHSVTLVDSRSVVVGSNSIRVTLTDLMGEPAPKSALTLDSALSSTTDQTAISDVNLEANGPGDFLIEIEQLSVPDVYTLEFTAHLADSTQLKVERLLKIFSECTPKNTTITTTKSKEATDGPVISFAYPESRIEPIVLKQDMWIHFEFELSCSTQKFSPHQVQIRLKEKTSTQFSEETETELTVGAKAQGSTNLHMWKSSFALSELLQASSGPQWNLSLIIGDIFILRPTIWQITAIKLDGDTSTLAPDTDTQDQISHGATIPPREPYGILSVLFSIGCIMPVGLFIGGCVQLFMNSQQAFKVPSNAIQFILSIGFQGALLMAGYALIRYWLSNNTLLESIPWLGTVIFTCTTLGWFTLCTNSSNSSATSRSKPKLN